VQGIRPAIRHSITVPWYMSDQPHMAFIGLGSNLGDKPANLAHARQCLEQAGAQVFRASSVYLTEPVDFKEQGSFLNQVLEIRTVLSARALLQCCLTIEQHLGRQRIIDKGPRLIDLDILFFDQLIISQPDLVIPHPRLQWRRFVLVPLVEINPDWMHPVLRAPAVLLLQRCPDQGIVEIFH
jgi:2-amino-4-hydroxy-6-hydroxymethyldihydropteridine diphosphokinase